MTALPLRLRSYWITGEIGNCDDEWDDFKTCFWLRQFTAKEAELWEAKLMRARNLQHPPPPSANGTVWPARTQPPAGWAHPGSGIPDDPEDVAPPPAPSGVGSALSSAWASLPSAGSLWQFGQTSTSDSTTSSKSAEP